MAMTTTGDLAVHGLDRIVLGIGDLRPEHEDVEAVDLLEGPVEGVGLDGDLEALGLGLLAHLLDEQTGRHSGVAGKHDLHDEHVPLCALR